MNEVERLRQQHLRDAERCVVDAQDELRRYERWRNLLIALWLTEVVLMGISALTDISALGAASLVALPITSILMLFFYRANHLRGRNQHRVALRAAKHDYEDVLLEGMN